MNTFILRSTTENGLSHKKDAEAPYSEIAPFPQDPPDMGLLRLRERIDSLPVDKDGCPTLLSLRVWIYGDAAISSFEHDDQKLRDHDSRPTSFFVMTIYRDVAIRSFQRNGQEPPFSRQVGIRVTREKSHAELVEV